MIFRDILIIILGIIFMLTGFFSFIYAPFDLYKKLLFVFCISFISIMILILSSEETKERFGEVEE